MTFDLAMVAALPMLGACLWDVRYRLIPDWACAGVALVGGAAALAAGTLAPTLLAGGLALAAGALAARAGAWGWGDAKLLPAAALVAGLPGLLPLLLGTAVAGGLMATALLLVRGPVLTGRLVLPSGAPRWLRAEQTRLRRAPTLPYALAIAAGLTFAWLA
jgi:prepilin peptidase CpaA